MLKIITLNLNGIRSAARKGVFAWLEKQNADVICLQELRAQETDLQDPQFTLPNYHAHFYCAEKKGYSGVGIYSRHQPKQVVKGLGWQTADCEGRYVAIDLGKLWVASIYLPSGTSGDERQTIKYDFLNQYEKKLCALTASLTSSKKEILPPKEFIICGDWNIAHKNMDLKNWRGNQKNSGFLPEERAWLDKLFGPLGFTDAFRVVNQEPDQYTWWSNRGQAWLKNVGWRIDYQVVTSGLKSSVKSASIYKAERFSDHAPLTIEYDIIL